jgi:hypothetical protein
VGIDLELADVAAARYQLGACQDSGIPCGHDPDCAENVQRLLARGPAEFPYRRFRDLNETMRLTGMGYEAESTPFPADDRTAVDRWRAQTVPGKSGIAAFKLRSNDRWLVTVREIDEALAAYATVPADRRAALESDPKWADWLRWLSSARTRGGFEAE